MANPLLIIEVLSNSTERYDRGEKFRFYRSLPALREYLLADQSNIRIEQYSLRQQDKWMLTDYGGAEAVLHCTSIDFQTALQEIYHHVEFERAATKGKSS